MLIGNRRLSFLLFLYTQQVQLIRSFSSVRPHMPSNTRISAPYEDDGKRLPRVSFATFVATSIAIPVVGITVLPLSILYQCGSVAFRRMNSIVHRSTASGQRLNRLDSGYLVDESQIIPLAKRQYDIVILGATGFTGYLAARHIVKTYGNKIRWAIAGRSPEKLQSVIQRLSQEVEGAGTTTALKIDTIICDTSVPSTLPNLVANTRVVATTAGPYSLYGTSVVEFCAKFGTHYVDITGEVDWVKAMLCEYQETAQKIGAKIIPFCGHDSVPWDLSLMKMQEELQDRFDDNVQSVMFWDEFRSDAPGGTYATILNAISGNTIKAPKMKFDPFLQLPDGSKSEFVCNSDFRSLLPAPSTSPWESPSSKRWSAPFVMAVVNFQVARWSHALRCKGSKTLKYSEVAVHPDFPTAFTNVAFLAMFGTMLLNPITATILMKFVIPKPGDGPSMEQMENKNFLCVRGEAIGEKGNRVESIFYLSKDAGCLETSRMMVESGLCLALSEDELPTQPSGKGGFMSPAAGLGNVLLKRLVATGTHFETKGIPVHQIRSKL